MTLSLPVFDTTNTGTLIVLSGGDELYVPEVVNLSSGFAGPTINTMGSGNSITVLGNIVATTTAMTLSATSVKETVRIEGTGVVRAITGVFCGGNADIRNDGTLLGKDYAILLDMTSGLTATRNITNTGLIASPVKALSVYGVPTSGSFQTTVLNLGTIMGNYAINFDTGYSGAQFHITNRGLLDGTVTLNAGADQLDNFGGRITAAVDLGAGNDVMVASASAESVDGGGDTDLLDFGKLGGAVVFLDGLTPNGGSATGDRFSNFENVNGSELGRDWITGSGGGNVINGRGGNDLLYGMGGGDRLAGGAGNDLLDGGSGTDVMTGGAGNDIYVVDTAADQVIELAGGGQDLIRSGVSLTLGGNVEDAIIVSATGLALTGNGLANHLTGGVGGDVLNGRAGVDFLRGGVGADQFVFSAAAEAGDKLLDFAHGSDHIALRAAGFGGGLAPGALAAGRFWSAATNLAHDADDRIIFRTSDQTLWFDANGNAAGGLKLIADLQAGAVVTAADILLI